MAEHSRSRTVFASRPARSYSSAFKRARGEKTVREREFVPFLNIYLLARGSRLVPILLLASGGFKKANRSATDKSKAKRAERRGALGSFSLQK